MSEPLNVQTNQTVRNPDRVQSIKISLRPSQLKRIKGDGHNPSIFIRSLIDEHYNKSKASDK